MAQPQLQAQFFGAPDGTVIMRAEPLTPSIRRAIFERDGKFCRCCGVPVVLFRAHTRPPFGPSLGVVDHIFPRARGGQNDPSNLRVLCETCNSQKGAK